MRLIVDNGNQMNEATHMTETVIGFNSSKTHFDVIGKEIATAMLVRGNAEGINRVCENLPYGTIAEMTQGKKTKITLSSPSGDKITRESGRVDAKQTLSMLKSMGVRVFNVKKGGLKVEC